MKRTGELDDLQFLSFIHELDWTYPPLEWPEEKYVRPNPTEKPRPPNDLPVDDEIERLLSRTAAPRIDLDRPGILFALHAWGPYCLVRSHLENCYHPPEWVNPNAEANRRAFLAQRLDDVDTAMGALVRLLQTEPWQVAHRLLVDDRHHGFERRFAYERHAGRQLRQEELDFPPSQLWRTLTGNMDDIERALQTLRRHRHIITDELRLTVQVKATGRPRIVWKQWFVAQMAHLWRLLTGHEASRDEHSMFAAFVEAAWHSLGADMPEQSFAQAIKTRPRPSSLAA
jgi:hypothetical protein